MAGCDEKGPHLFETCPSGNYFELFGSNSQHTGLNRAFCFVPKPDRDRLAQVLCHGHRWALNLSKDIPGLLAKRRVACRSPLLIFSCPEQRRSISQTSRLQMSMPWSSTDWRLPAREPTTHRLFLLGPRTLYLCYRTAYQGHRSAEAVAKARPKTSPGHEQDDLVGSVLDDQEHRSRRD